MTAQRTDIILDGDLELQPKFVAVNATVNGDNEMVASVSNRHIRVLGYTLGADAAVGAAFEDGAGGAELSGQIPFAANDKLVVPNSQYGHFETSVSTALSLELDANANVRGHLVYVEATPSMPLIIRKIVAGTDGQTETFVVYKADGVTALDITGGTGPKIRATPLDTDRQEIEISGTLGTTADGEIDIPFVDTTFEREDVGHWKITPYVTLSGDEYIGQWEPVVIIHPLE